MFEMKRIVKVQGPVLTETGNIARVVRFEDGWGQKQTFNRPKKMWQKGGVSWQSLEFTERVSRRLLQDMGLSEKDIDEVLWRPQPADSR